MAQVTIHGLADQSRPVQAALSEAVHGAVMAALAHPPDKRFPRFFPLDRDDFPFPNDRSERYTVVEILSRANRPAVSHNSPSRSGSYDSSDDRLD